jgi:hypothetical protein
MRTRVALALAAALMLLISLAAVGSNMGFKIVIPLTASQTKYIALPYYCTMDGATIESGAAKAANLRNEILAAGASSCTVLWYTGSVWQRYAGGGLGQINFSLQSGEGYQVTCSPGVNLLVVGSHNPSLTVTLAASSTKYTAIPYHTTDSTAAQLRNEILASGASSCTVLWYNGSVWQRYAGGGLGQTNFTVKPGEAVQITCSPGISWMPAHY